MEITADLIMKRVREELRAEGPDGVGYSDFIIRNGVNAAIADLAEVYPVRDIVTFETQEDVNEYDLSDKKIYKINKVEYDNRAITYMDLDKYLNDQAILSEGNVASWVLYGNKFILVGKPENTKQVKLWVTRSPEMLERIDSKFELPDYTLEAVVAYAMSICYRESRNFSQADYYYRVFLNQKDALLRRAVPQGQRDTQPKMKDNYWGAFRPTKMLRPYPKEPLTLPDD